MGKNKRFKNKINTKATKLQACNLVGHPVKITTKPYLNTNAQAVAELSTGKKVFIPSALGAEEVLIDIVQEKTSYAIGKIHEILKPSADRQPPFCQYYDDCGGCNLQHMQYSAQLNYKFQQVYNAFIHIASFTSEYLAPLFPLGKTAHACLPNLNYRTKLQFPLGLDKQNKLVTGFYRNGTHQLVASDICDIQHPAADIVRASLLKTWEYYPLSVYNEKTHKGLLRHLLIRCSETYNTVQITLVVNTDRNFVVSGLDDFLQKFIELSQANLNRKQFSLASVYLNYHSAPSNLVHSYDYKEIYFAEDLRENIVGLDFYISPAAFFQVNPRQTQELFSCVANFANLNGTETVFDLYCGAGSIGLVLAKMAKKVIGIEVIEAAIADARRNAKLNHIYNTEFYCGKAEQVLPILLEKGLVADLMVVDPPRKGLDATLISCISTNPTARLIYVSCNPATLARDCKLLCQEAGFQITKLEVFDMFPWTSHVETIVLMSRK